MRQVLCVDNISFGYNKSLLYDGLSFALPEGSFTAILGPNGVGKSTVIKNICALLPMRAGRILFCGRDVTALSVRELAKGMAVVNQQNDISFDFTVEETVFMGRLPHMQPWERESAKDREAVRKALAMTNCAPLAGRLITTLSGGERQRALLARALAQEPLLLLLDEPTSHLDIKHRLEIMSILAQLNKKGMTIAAVLHDINLAMQFADQALLLNEGRLEACGPPHEVLTPENINRVYQVRTELAQTSDGARHLLPLSGGGEESNI